MMIKNVLNSGSFSPMKEKEFKYFIYSRFLYVMALRMVGTIVAYKLFQLTQSSLAIGLVGLAEFLPVFSLALYAGHVIDLSDKRTLLLKAIIAYSCCVVLLIVATSSWMAGKLSTKYLELFFYFIIFLTGIIRAFAGPTSNAIIAQLVPRDILHHAAQLSSSTFLGASILGHASAGFFIAWFGTNTSFYFILAYILIAAFFISRIEKKPKLVAKVAGKTWASVKEGLHYVYNNKILLGAITLDLFAVLFGGAVALLPEFADKILKVGPIGFGWLNASLDIGSVIMIILLTLFPMQKNQGRILFFVVGGFGICILLFGISEFFWLSFLALLIAGMFDGVSIIIRSTILQLKTPDEMRGRVSSVNSMFINSSNELGQFESGITARMFGAVPAVLFGGAMTLLVVIITWIKAPALRKFEY